MESENLNAKAILPDVMVPLVCREDFGRRVSLTRRTSAQRRGQPKRVPTCHACFAVYFA